MAPYLTKWIAQKKGRNAVNLGTGTPVRGTSLQQIIREDLVAWMATADFEACKPHLENAFRDSAIRSIPRSKEHVASSLLEATGGKYCSSKQKATLQKDGSARKYRSGCQFVGPASA